MSNLDFDTFAKKYSFAIDGLKMRLSDSEKKNMLAKKLYDDSMTNAINMTELNRALELFYQGNVLGQLNMNKYVEKYSK